MVEDDVSKKDLSKLDDEIDSKVDALFVDTDGGVFDSQQEASGLPEDKRTPEPDDEGPLKTLTELCLTLDWEISEELL